MFLLSLTAISALGVIAGGSFWTAQSMYRVTDNKHRVMVRFCSSVPKTLGFVYDATVGIVDPEYWTLASAPLVPGGPNQIVPVPVCP